MEQPAPTGQLRTFETQDAAEIFRRGAAMRAEWLGPATHRMLALAGIRAGSHVIDVAAGTGEQTIEAAHLVGPSGHVLATDISAAMLDVAAAMARELGLANVETRTADAQNLGLDPESFDAAISRLGLMFIPDLSRGLSQVKATLKQGGKFAAIVWGSAEKNPYLSVTGAVLRQRHEAAGLPPRPFVAHVLGEPETLAGALQSAGFHAVDIVPISHTRRFSSAAQAVQAVIDEVLTMRALATDLEETDRAAALAEAATGLRQFEGPAGVEIPGEMLLGVGTK